MQPKTAKVYNLLKSRKLYFTLEEFEATTSKVATDLGRLIKANGCNAVKEAITLLTAELAFERKRVNDAMEKAKEKELPITSKPRGKRGRKRGQLFRESKGTNRSNLCRTTTAVLTVALEIAVDNTFTTKALQDACQYAPSTVKAQLYNGQSLGFIRFAKPFKKYVFTEEGLIHLAS